MYIDITHKPAAFLKERFPEHLRNVHGPGDRHDKTAASRIVPAAHYQCGGVKTDLEGATTLRGSFCRRGRWHAPACTGPTDWPAIRCSRHLVYGRAVRRGALEAQIFQVSSGHSICPNGAPGHAQDVDELVVIYHNWDEIGRLMWDYVGIVRTKKRLLVQAPGCAIFNARSRTFIGISGSRRTSSNCEVCVPSQASS